MRQPVILVVSLMTEQGFCGVQTHFRAVMAQARLHGFEARLIEPHQVNHWLRRGPSLVGRVLRRIDQERAVLWNRACAYHYLRVRLRQSLREMGDRPMVIYAQDPLSARAALAMRDAGFTFRLVGVLHFNVSEAYECQLNGLTREGGPLWRQLMRTEQEALPRLDQVIFVSEYMRRIVVARVPRLAQVAQAVLPNFPEHAFAPNAMTTTPRADLISIGTLEPRKNQRYLLEVLAAAKRMGYRYRLTLVGDGPSRREWEAHAQRLGIADQVDFLGYVRGAAHLLAGHRAYVHAARMESFGIVFLEALACGLPLFASPVGGVPEVFDDGVEGRHWPLNDPGEGARRLIAVLEDAATWQRMSTAARLRYQTRYAPEVLGPRWLTEITGGGAATVKPGVPGSALLLEAA